MSFPLFDPINLPPDTVLIDVNSIADDDLRQSYQAQALELWVEEENDGDWEFAARDWDVKEGIFVVEEGGVAIGIAIVIDVEAL